MDKLKRCYIKPLTSRWEVAQIIAQLRQEDLDELVASGYEDASAAIDGIWEFALGQEQALALEGVFLPSGEPLAIGGCGVACGVGIPWILCTVRSSAHPVALWEAVRFKAPLWDAAYPRQMNRAWVPNTRHIALIRKLGYKFSPEVCPRGFITFSKGI